MTIADKTALDPDVTAGVAQFLGPVVVGLQALAIDAKQLHWHVRGVNYIAIHELFDTVVDHAREAADLAAERIVALGLPIDARAQTIGSKSPTPKLEAGFQQWEKSVDELIAAIDAVTAVARAAVDGLADLDPVSQDTAIQITAGLEKDRWFLFSHVAK